MPETPKPNFFLEPQELIDDMQSKLKITLDSTERLALLHGYSEGIKAARYANSPDHLDLIERNAAMLFVTEFENGFRQPS